MRKLLTFCFSLLAIIESNGAIYTFGPNNPNLVSVSNVAYATNAGNLIGNVWNGITNSGSGTLMVGSIVGTAIPLTLKSNVVISGGTPSNTILEVYGRILAGGVPMTSAEEIIEIYAQNTTNAVQISSYVMTPNTPFGALRFKNRLSTGWELARVQSDTHSQTYEGRLTFWTSRPGQAGVVDEAMRIFPGGNVAIGSTNSASKLNVNGTITGSGLNISNGIAISGTPYPGGQPLLDLKQGYTGESPAVTVLASGSVGIGTTNPATLLQVAGTVTATNYLLSAVRWKDAPITFAYVANGGLSPTLTVLTNGINLQTWADNQYLDGIAQINHDIAPSNSALYTELHAHLLSATAPAADANRTQLRFVWTAANIGGAAIPVRSNQVEVVLTPGFMGHTIVDAGHLAVTNFWPNISAIYTCTITRLAASGSNYSGGLNLTADVHYPVDRFGSATDTAP